MSNTNNHEAVMFDNRDIARYGAGERRMAMRGFEPEYPDIVDYIVRITHRIWEEKEVGYIYDTYQHNCIVHASGGDIHGRDAVVASTLQTLAAYAVDRGYANDVIWAGNERDGFHTSHLVLSGGHNTGYTKYGPPTGRQITWRAIANCLAKENMIFEEWLLRDEPHVIRQLGFDIDTVVAQQVRAMVAQGIGPTPVGDPERIIGQHAPAPLAVRTGGGFDVEDFIRSTYHEIWNRRMLNVVTKRYARGHIGTTTGNRSFHGTGEQTSFILDILAMFPDAGLSVDQVYWQGDDETGYRVAVRWTLSGTHLGYGYLGTPSGARVRAMGLSQHHIKNGVFQKEFSLFDEMEIRRQIALRRLTNT